MARGAWHRALDAFLHQLRSRPAEEILRSFPQGRGYRLGQTAQGGAPSSPSRREIRRTPRKRMAARAHAVDQILHRPGKPDALQEFAIIGCRRDLRWDEGG